MFDASLMEAPRDGVLINSMLKRPADISKPEILYGEQIHRICNFTMLQPQPFTVITMAIGFKCMEVIYVRIKNCIVTATLM